MATADFDVRPDQLDDQAKDLDTAGEEVDSVKGGLPTPSRYPARVLGGAEVGAAFDAFADAWLTECTTLGGALHELADRLRASADNYRSTENEAVAMLGHSMVLMPHGLATPMASAGGGSPFG
ncbi:WXG100 family type VII secretion target [Streptomyces sp. NPDC059740]|uniref:WXG100 family type VII secretion target n=1 Tax=Streptomyces sp. NPDC059740 TaxID=3346926 RepID=UPI003651E7F9